MNQTAGQPERADQHRCQQQQPPVPGEGREQRSSDHREHRHVPSRSRSRLKVA